MQINIRITADETGVHIQGERMRVNGKSLLSEKLLARDLEHHAHPASTVSSKVGNMVTELIEN